MSDRPRREWSKVISISIAIAQNATNLVQSKGKKKTPWGRGWQGEIGWLWSLRDSGHPLDPFGCHSLARKMGEPGEARSVKEAGSGWEAGSNMWEKRVGCLGLGKEEKAKVGVKAVFPTGGSDSAVGF